MSDQVDIDAIQALWVAEGKRCSCCGRAHDSASSRRCIAYLHEQIESIQRENEELERPLADAVEEQTPLRLDVKLDGVWLVAEPECGPKGIINLSHLVERMPKSIAKTAACNAIGESVSAILTALEGE